MSRFCRGCEEEKDLDCFWKNRHSSDGFHLLCKICAPLYNKKYKTKHYVKNKEALNEKARKYWHENKEQRTAYDKEYRNKFPDKRPQACKRWRNSRPEQIILYNARRSAKIRNQECTLTLEDIIIPKNCPICNVLLTIQTKNKDSASIDRIDNSKSYIPGNIGIICWGCNKLKSNASLEHLQAIVRYMEERCRFYV